MPWRSITSIWKGAVNNIFFFIESDIRRIFFLDNLNNNNNKYMIHFCSSYNSCAHRKSILLRWKWSIGKSSDFLEIPTSPHSRRGHSQKITRLFSNHSFMACNQICSTQSSMQSNGNFPTWISGVRPEMRWMSLSYRACKGERNSILPKNILANDRTRDILVPIPICSSLRYANH